MCIYVPSAVCWYAEVPSWILGLSALFSSAAVDIFGTGVDVKLWTTLEYDLLAAVVLAAGTLAAEEVFVAGALLEDVLGLLDPAPLECVAAVALT